MSTNQQHQEEDPLAIAQQAERDLNSHSAKVGHAGSLSGKRNHPSFSFSFLFSSPPPLVIPGQKEDLKQKRIGTDDTMNVESKTAEESGVDETATKKFPGSSVTYGSAASSGAGDNREIPVEEGGSVSRETGR